MAITNFHTRSTSCDVKVDTALMLLQFFLVGLLQAFWYTKVAILLS